MRAKVAKGLLRQAKKEFLDGKIKAIDPRYKELKWLYIHNTGHMIERNPLLKTSRRQIRIKNHQA